MTQVLCITGMHRSGTSLAASWFERCHLPIADGRVLGPGVGNPRGHFEDLEFSDLQDQAIKRTHGSWRATEPHPLTFNAREIEEAQRLVARRNAAYPLWGWKDPRTVLFLHEWKRVISGLKVLIVWRSCAEVVDSLRKRARMADADLDLDIGLRDAVRVWRSYNTAACAFKTAYPDDVMLVPIELLISDGRQLLDEIHRLWNIRLTYIPMSEVMDDTLFNRRATARSRIGARVGRTKGLEQELQRLSWQAPLT
jgi:hypothetical protein